MTAPSAPTPIRWTFVALGALSGAVALVPWPLWWSNLLAYHGEPATRWRIFLGLSALGLLVAGILYRRLKDAPILGGTAETGLRSAFPLCCALVLLVAAALPRLYWPADWVKLGAPDHVEYALGAHNLLERGTYAIELNGTLHPPRYPYGYSTFFVAPVLAVTGSEPRHAVYAGMVSGILVVLLLAAMGGRGFGAVTAAGSVFLLLLYPLFLKYTREVFADAAVTALFLGVFTLALCLRPSPIRWLAVGLFIAVAASVKFSLVLSAIFPWLVVRLPVAKNDSSESRSDLSGGRPWTTTRRQLLLDLCLASGIGIGLVPLLIYNTQCFGEPFRTGYHYWCSLPYDFPALVFSPRYLWQSADTRGVGNVVYYLLPGGEMAEKTPYYVIQVGYWLLVLVGLILGWNAPGSTRRAVRLMAAGSSLQLAFFSFYFFRNTRLLLPVYVLLLPAAVYALVRLIRVPLQLERSRVVGMCFAAWLAAGFWFLGPHYRGFEKTSPTTATPSRRRPTVWCPTMR